MVTSCLSLPSHLMETGRTLVNRPNGSLTLEDRTTRGVFWVKASKQGAVMTVERDFTTVSSRLAKATRAVRDARKSLNSATREISGRGAALRDIDQFTAREACSVLAALRLVQVIQ